MRTISRREVLTTATVAAGTLFLAGKNAADAAPPLSSAASGISPVYGIKHEVKPLPFDPSKLKGISEKLIVSHHDKNYAGAVKRLPTIQKRIAELSADAPPYMMSALKREELIAMNSMIMHELYFGNLGGDGKVGGAIGGDIERLIKQSFGSYEAWEHDFRATGMSLGGGSGWALMAFSFHDGEIHNVWCADHLVNLAAGVPLLVMDMYEHAYQMDYGADAKSYIDAFFANINWEKANERTACVVAHKK